MLIVTRVDLIYSTLEFSMHQMGMLRAQRIRMMLRLSMIHHRMRSMMALSTLALLLGMRLAQRPQLAQRLECASEQLCEWQREMRVVNKWSHC